MYPIKFQNHPALQWIPAVNPMIPIIESFRDCFMGRSLQNPTGLWISAIIALITFFAGWTAFHKAEFKFAEYV